MLLRLPFYAHCCMKNYCIRTLSGFENFTNQSHRTNGGCLVDKQFPSLAKSETADFISGGNHRWKGGHDLFMDVLPEFFRDPPRAMHDLGHILLTDFLPRQEFLFPVVLSPDWENG